jgi:ATP-dependent exoDNAse (exonuclease V) beta subunit
MERLLYVALTRAQHALVLAFDNELFAKASGEIHSHSQSKWLKADKNDVNEAAFARIGVEPASCANTAEHHRAGARARIDKSDIQLPTAKIDKAVAVRNASVFVRKLNPSGLPSEESAALEEIRYAPSPSLRSTSPALRYGLWWHDFIQRLSWNENPDSWNRVFDEQKSISPDPTRSLREWKLLLTHLSGLENFRRQFEENDLAHSEMPFFWRVDDTRCLEGVIDLAFFQRSNASAARTGKCLILDWKTDRVPPDNTETLHARYRPQLAAYWKAVSEIAKLDIEAAIYSTAAGALVRYTTDELEQEWSRLEKLPPDQFEVEMTKELAVTATTPVPTKSEQLEFAQL